jgi:glycosyltransferase involved in cell wall biosynthesis
MQPMPNSDPPEESEQPEALKGELDYLRYQLQASQRASQGLQNELAEIKGSKAWTAVILYRKLLELPRRVLRKTARTATGMAKTGRLLVRNTMEVVQTGQAGRRVAILTPTFLNYDGNNMFFGGAERYVIELVHLISELGYDPEVFQCGSSDWVRYYFDFKITGLNVHGDNNLLSSQFYQLKQPFQMVIYSPFGLATRKLEIPSIGISHGIYWDAPINYPAWMHAAKYARAILGSIEKCTRMVSVDTNTVNWVRATSLDRAARCLYIPNFVDLEQFRPVERIADSGRLTVLYPRRLYTPRGFWLISEILPDLLHDYSQLDFHFVGKADPQEEERVRELVKAFPGRVKWYFLPPEEMHTAYQQADITLIPTLHSEGTSLSCLEALASGNAVIATNVGGLPDLILNGHNGLLVEPNAASLRRALSLLCGNAGLRHRLQTNGRAVAEAFDIKRWRDEWRTLLAELLPPAAQGTGTPAQAPKFAVVAPPEGVTWNSPAGEAHSTALDLSARGYETYWINPGGRLPDPAEHLHVVSEADDLYLSRPLLFLFSTETRKLEERLGDARIAYKAGQGTLEPLETLLERLKE